MQAVMLLSGFRFCLVYSRENGINCVFGKHFKLLKEWLPFHLSRICDTEDSNHRGEDTGSNGSDRRPGRRRGCDPDLWELPRPSAPKASSCPSQEGLVEYTFV